MEAGFEEGCPRFIQGDIQIRSRRREEAHEEQCAGVAVREGQLGSPILGPSPHPAWKTCSHPALCSASEEEGRSRLLSRGSQEYSPGLGMQRRLGTSELEPGLEKRALDRESDCGRSLVVFIISSLM